MKKNIFKIGNTFYSDLTSIADDFNINKHTLYTYFKRNVLIRTPGMMIKYRNLNIEIVK